MNQGETNKMVSFLTSRTPQEAEYILDLMGDQRKTGRAIGRIEGAIYGFVVSVLIWLVS